MKILTLIVTLIIASTSFTLKAESDPLVINSTTYQTVSKINYTIVKANGRKSNTLVGALIGGKYKRERHFKFECKGRGHLLTIAHLDDYGRVKYHAVRSVRRDSKCTL